MLHNQQKHYQIPTSLGVPYDLGLNLKPTQQARILFNARVTC